jgi:dolichyl-phosphate-mannose--protein O-mannosyl transferase
VGVVFVLYKIARLYISSFSSGIASLILLSCKGLLSHHISRTGDMDALIASFMLAAMNFFLLYHAKTFEYPFVFSNE